MDRTRTDAGFSLVEMVLAIFLLGILAMATLPLFMTVTQTTAYNRDLGTASSYANSIITEIRAHYPDGVTGTACSTVADVANAAQLAVPAPAGSHLTATVRVDDCPASGYPVALPVTVTVFPSGATAADDAFVSVPTQVFVGAP